MRHLTRRLIASTAAPALVFASTVAAFVGGAVGGTTAFADGTTRYVATTGSDSANTCLVLASPCLTLGHALSQATFDNTIELSPGTYLVSDNPTGTANAVPSTMHDLTIEANPSGGTAANTIIDATGEPNGLLINADNATIRNLTFRNADLRGIVVTPPTDAVTPAVVSNLTLTGNVVSANDQCTNHPGAPDCPVSVGDFGYGGGIGLVSVVGSTVDSNTVTGNLGGGIMLTDDLGPNHDNTISHNTASTNGVGCGITLVGANPHAFGSNGPNAGQIFPSVAGVYHNLISGNTANGNHESGVCIGGATDGTAAYSNTVLRNTTNDNGFPGIMIFGHALLQDLNNNAVTDNHVSHDGLAAPSPVDIGDQHTTGILVTSLSYRITGTVITGNTISDVYFGVWMGARTPRATVEDNTIAFVAGGAAIHVETLGALDVRGFATTQSGRGYWQADSAGGVFPFGDAGYFGSIGAQALASPIVGIAPALTGRGYWLVASDGGVFAFGSAKYYGSASGVARPGSIVGIAADPSGLGYWLVGSDGGVFSYGSAKFHGSAGALHLNKPVVGMDASFLSGAGYWLVASDGGIFTYGSASFHGSAGALHLNKPVVGMTATPPSGAGYWLVASDGGVFSYGNARYHGSTGAIRLVRPIVGMAETQTPDRSGYWLCANDGGIFAFGDAVYYGSESANPSH